MSYAMRTSGQSQQSRSISQYMTTSASDVEELSDEDLVRSVNNLKHQIKILSLENMILENVIMRVEPALMHGVQQALDYAFKIQSSSSLNVGSFVKSQTSRVAPFGLSTTSQFPEFSTASPSRMLISPSKASTRKFQSSANLASGTVIFGTGPKINILERSELVSAEMEILIRHMERSRSKAARQHALLKAQLEEISVRVHDIEKATESFNQEVIIEGWDKIAQRIPAEVWVRYMNEWVKVCDKEIGKLRLRTSTLNTQYVRLKGQIKVKTELSEMLRPVDFEKLKIENKQLLEIIDRKMVQLAELKGMTGDANLTLAMHKKAMMDQNAYLQGVQADIESKKRLAIERDNEREIIEDQADALSAKLDTVRKVRLAYEVPDIMDYVKVRSEMCELRRVVKRLENRSHVQQIALKSLNKQLHSMFF